MDKWKDELKHAFNAPPPVRKQDFLRRSDLRRMPVCEFLLSQAGYIRKWVWCVSALIFAVSVLGLAFLPGRVLWLISGLTPLMALTILAASGRSELYYMAEMEMATRFSLRSVIFARLAILGMMNILLLGILLLLGFRNGTAAPLAAALYIITPFLLTTFIGLHIVRTLRGPEAMYACAGTSAGISTLLFLSHNVISFIYREQFLAVWMTAAVLLIFGNGKQCAALINKTEEPAWNLS